MRSDSSLIADLILILLALLFPLFKVIIVCEPLQTYEHMLVILFAVWLGCYLRGKMCFVLLYFVERVSW